MTRNDFMTYLNERMLLDPRTKPARRMRSQLSYRSWLLALELNLIVKPLIYFSSCLQTSQWWLLRCLCAQQQILDDKSNTLRETVKELIENSE